MTFSDLFHYDIVMIMMMWMCTMSKSAYFQIWMFMECWFVI